MHSIPFIYFTNNGVLFTIENTYRLKGDVQMSDTIGNTQRKSLLLGILFTFLIALLGYALALVPGFNRVGPLACAIVIAIVYRQFFGYPKPLTVGVQFTSKYILRLAIILYGLKLNIYIIFEDGLGLLLMSIIAIVVAIFVTVYIGKLLRAESELTLLLGIGTGVCGAAAIAAAAPILKAKAENTAMGIAIIALVGTVFSIIYTLLLPFLPLSAADYAIWSGLSLHELAHVALAAEPAGESELAFALLAKLTRVFLLVPLCFILIYWLKKRASRGENANSKIPFPYFLLGFIVMSLFGSFVIGNLIMVSPQTMEMVNQLSTFLLSAAMVGLGLNVSLDAIRQKALRPLLAMLLASIILSVAIFSIVVYI